MRNLSALKVSAANLVDLLLRMHQVDLRFAGYKLCLLSLINLPLIKGVFFCLNVAKWPNSVIRERPEFDPNQTVENWRYKYSHISQNAKLTLKLSHSSIDDTLALGGAKRSHAPLFFVF